MSACWITWGGGSVACCSLKGTAKRTVFFLFFLTKGAFWRLNMRENFIQRMLTGAAATRMIARDSFCEVTVNILA